MPQIDAFNQDDILHHIQTLAAREEVRVTQHGHFEMVEDGLVLDEVLYVISNATILENYPEHRRGACCLLNGYDRNGHAVHVVCTTTTPVLIIITVYRPRLPKWTTPTQRNR